MSLTHLAAEKATLHGRGTEEVVCIPDGEYGRELWADAEDEGLGAASRT